jgi:hypothetical protein
VLPFELLAVPSILTVEKPQNCAENDAYNDAGRKRKIEVKVLPLDDDVTRQPAQAEAGQPRPSDAD